MTNRNEYRVLSDEMIKDISKKVAADLIKYSREVADTLMDHYLRGDAEGLLNIINDWIESAEDERINQLNQELIEESFKQAEDGHSYNG